MTTPISPSPTPLTYRDAGVDIDAGHALVERIKPLVKRSFRPEVMSGLGGFGALFNLAGKYKEPVLVSGTDGVGTKLKLAQQLNRHNTIGIDLVAMCVNDVLVQGAEPLFFLDYFATSKLDIDTATAVIGGIALGCEQSGCALIGGETAEMPDMYLPGEYDLAGFCVAAVEKSQLLDGSQVREGDVLIGIASSGPHSNGYSLIRRIYERAGSPDDLDIGGTRLIDALMAPTTLYVKPVLALLQTRSEAIHAMAHITGGGLTENIIRVIPPSLGLDLDTSAWPQPPVFQWLQHEGTVTDTEMWRTFNCGIGFVLVTAANQVSSLRQALDHQGLAHWRIGQVITHAGNERVRIS
ncbi:phosphoribosylformylglycinamidine cyclo-ligase [Xylella taiwanensis]|uniref:Phosphoribosylformylglycinamidine cyclo-ligase n=1 Tax=Xylella taiwanensis TaxID=1444770 RepID=A0ABS8TR28_9GAMM|nr:phosphoribosylformylglycinamidine cyclo-ligase [Xylella taiwanensis]AXI84056.1 phosphoribosylaminoimidazole synthetase [Xylella taiwanensis]MCD8457170.1 phosphoribosylformylglycinamidine cyclo-ligase [Xylella taiwanensis]MCD8459579.1 phosphoribosylformylglycinamidine cyclo-ligase [Xylella taiwanensis]MCD8461554.1 phosphoribosylformylglycinamidine cyclo-ligase [Xylella taiwanensis]MCD8462420.1 phosphoribosylformylglycinamidine cyclo-ligase [Xylella taiwanensis]